jgi:hypothetical protein
VNHRIFERTLRPLAFRGAHPFECREILKTPSFAGKDFGLGGLLLASPRSELLLNGLVGSALPILDVIRCFYVSGFGTVPLLLTVSLTMMVFRSPPIRRWEA